MCNNSVITCILTPLTDTEHARALHLRPTRRINQTHGMEKSYEISKRGPIKRRTLLNDCLDCSVILFCFVGVASQRLARDRPRVEVSGCVTSSQLRFAGLKITIQKKVSELAATRVDVQTFMCRRWTLACHGVTRSGVELGFQTRTL